MKVIQNARKIFLVIAVLATSVLTGCATTGPVYEAVSEVPSGKALVYIYRPKAFKGAAISYDIHVGPKEDDREIVTLKNGGYFPYFAEPGELELWAKTETTAAVTLDLNPGDVKYVEGKINIGFMAGRPALEIVDGATAEEKIKSCKLLTAKEG